MHIQCTGIWTENSKLSGPSCSNFRYHNELVGGQTVNLYSKFIYNLYYMHNQEIA